MTDKRLKFLGYLLSALAFYYIYSVIISTDLNWSYAAVLIQGNDYYFLGLAILLNVLILLIGATLWSLIINMLSSEKVFKNHLHLILIHAKTNLAKYLPGNVMQFVGRNVLGRSLGYRHQDIIMSSFLEIILSVFTGVIILLMMLFLNVFELNFSYFNYLNEMPVLYPVVLLVIAFGVLFMLMKKRDKVSTLYKSILAKKHLIMYVFIGYLITFLIMGLCNSMVYYALNGGVIFNDFLKLTLVYIFSWILGFVIPGPPGGIGVREAVYISALSGSYDMALITLVAVVMRLINVIGDIIYYLICEVLSFKSKFNSDFNK